MGVATVLTVYGIETTIDSRLVWILALQQYLPFTVLKQLYDYHLSTSYMFVATVLTVYGIETPEELQSNFVINKFSCNSTYRLRYWNIALALSIATKPHGCNSTYRLRYWNRILLLKRYYLRMLQQYLPFTVLKQESILIGPHLAPLQQYLPFTVLKLCKRYWIRLKN